MVVESTLDLAYLGFFLGARINELVRARGAKRGFPGMRDSYGYLIQHLIEKDRTISELAARMEISQQAVSKFVAEMARHGTVEYVPTRDGRVTTVRLSKRGWEAVRFARRTRAQLERRLQKAVGQQRYREAQQVLAACLAALGGLQRVRTRRVLLPR
jgi:DNA-binding MarR family transcriptional regulator